MELNYSHIVVRFGELSTKGKNRKDFISLLLNNIKEKLKEIKELTYEKNHDRLFIKLNGTDPKSVSLILDNIFGISSYSIALKTERDLDDILTKSFYILNNKGYKTFKIETKRQDKTFFLTSDELNRKIAGHILRNSNLKVDVKTPDALLKVEVRSDYVYLMADKYKGLGGFPVGINGKALVMMSGGIDSPVAAFYTMKRGLRIECIHFESSPYTSFEAINKVKELVKILTKYQSEIVLHIIPFTKLQLEIYKNCSEDYAITIMRRMMYRISDIIAKNKKILALSNGESIGQVASQTVESSYAIGMVTDRVIYRPLSTMDKVEIIDLARKIKTFDTSILPFEDCCTIFEPKSPTTKPKIDKCEYFESKFDYESLINEAILNDKIERISYFDKEEEIF